MTGRRGAVQPWEVCGWADNGTVTCLVLVYADGPEEHPGPYCSIMPRVGVPAASWPTPPEEGQLDSWLDGHLQAGRVVSLDTRIGDTFAIVYWVPVTRIPNAGAGLIAVADPVTAADHTWTLPQGVYVWFGAQTPDAPMPSLDTALSHRGRLDLGPRLAASARARGRAARKRQQASR